MCAEAISPSKKPTKPTKPTKPVKTQRQTVQKSAKRHGTSYTQNENAILSRTDALLEGAESDPEISDASPPPKKQTTPVIGQTV